MKIRMLRFDFVMPICLFIILGGFLWRGLEFKPQELPSALIGKHAPVFSLATVEEPNRIIDQSILQGKISVINVWATWCITCRSEHSVWMDLQKQFVNTNSVDPKIQFIGLNYHDTLQESQEWLQMAGNPYRLNLFDTKGKLGIDFGVYGTPETYILDKDGVIRFRHVGPITKEIWQTKFLPIIKNLNI